MNRCAHASCADRAPQEETVVNRTSWSTPHGHVSPLYEPISVQDQDSSRGLARGDGRLGGDLFYLVRLGDSPAHPTLVSRLDQVLLSPSFHKPHLGISSVPGSV